MFSPFLFGWLDMKQSLHRYTKLVKAIKMSNFGLFNMAEKSNSKSINLIQGREIKLSIFINLTQTS